MEKIFNTFNSYLESAYSITEKIKNIANDTAIPKSLKDSLANFDNYASKYTELFKSQSHLTEDGLERAKTVTNSGSMIGHSISKFKEANNELRELGREILESSSKTQDFIENSPINFNTKYENVRKSKEFGKSLNLENEIEIGLQYQNFESRIKKLISEHDLDIAKLSNEIENLDRKLITKIEETQSLYDNALSDINNKKKQIDDILGHVSGRAIAGDFQESAAHEKDMADWLRYSSIACMAFIVIIVGYSFWESTTADFNWQNSVFRIVLSFFLSIPAAYLARESAKHREQQNHHLQTSLDLKAITPYIASLPDDEQHKLKTQIASRIFAQNKGNNQNIESYPINTHEILMELIKKIDLKPGNTKN